jgi:antitoxin ParD1/3/4
MNKPAKPEADDVDDLSDLYGGPPPTEVAWDAWMEANRAEINASLRRARQELAEGKSAPWDPEAIMSEVREQLRKEGR